MAVSNANEIAKLSELKEKGIITEEEFQREKAKLLSGNTNTADEQHSAKTAQPTFIIQNSASSSAAATVVVKRRGCLGSLIKAIVALVVIVLVLDFFVWKSNNPKVSSSSTSSNTTQQVTSTVENKSCLQSVKDMAYQQQVQKICYEDLGVESFYSNLDDDDFKTYRESQNCPTLSTADVRIAEDQVAKAITNGLNKAPNKMEFCKTEQGYYNKVVQKYVKTR